MLGVNLVGQFVDKNSHRKKLHQKYSNTPPLVQYLSTQLPQKNQQIHSVDFVALDFETTGLNPSIDKILSFGAVELSADQIYLASSTEVILRNEQHIRRESAIINGILPQHILEHGVEVHAALNILLDKIAGKVLLAHNAQIELLFLQAIVEQCFGLPKLPCLVIDTLKLEKQFSYLSKRKIHGSYQLNELRSHYQLPDYHAHTAASDALACAELFLVQLRKFGLYDRQLKKLLV
ncbi:3'-5' exonuclease [Vibrio celticus]|uniref:3'-5' exonuclease n=1 Tax=Vibrio celticus TaxID=446372 RepID=UPI004067E20C